MIPPAIGHTPFSAFNLRACLEELDARLLWALDQCVRYVSQSSVLRAEALILTGSVARGEVTAVPTGSGLHCLSDVEFLVAVADRSDWNQRSAESARIGALMQKQAHEQGLECCFEFTPAPRRFFRNVKPSIFGYELRCHGKTLWGTHAYLANLPSFSASDIPRRDAFYLVCNRMIEQLEWWATFQQAPGVEATKSFSYSLVKTYIDLGTSMLVFADRYQPSYASRAKQLDSLKPLLAGHVYNINELLSEILRATALKLNPPASLLDPLTPNEFNERWNGLARDLLEVWKWELQTLQDADGQELGASLKRFARGESLHQQLVGWGKLARHAIRRGRLADLLRARWLRGDPRHLLYCEAASVYAACAGLDEPFLPTKPSGCHPFRRRSTGSLENRIHELLAVWQKYFRNN